MVFVISLFTNNLLAQGAYVNLNAGYGLIMSSQNLEFFGFYNYTSESDSYTAEQINVSLGKGLNFGGAFGYMFNKNIGAELGISYLLGDKFKAKETYSGVTNNLTLSSKMLRINPSFVIAAGFEKINPYAKLGLVIGYGSILFDNNANEDGAIVVREMKLNGGMALGLSSGIGAIFNQSDKMSFYSELTMVNLAYAPTKGEVTSATFNGVDNLPNMSISEKNVEFVDHYTYNSSNPPVSSQPAKELKQKLPFGSFGLNIGLRINF